MKRYFTENLTFSNINLAETLHKSRLPADFLQLSSIKAAALSTPAWTFLQNMSDSSAFVTSLRPRVRAILQNVAHLIAVVASGLFTVLDAVPCNVSGASATVASVQLWPRFTVPTKVPILLAFIALQAPSKAILSVPWIRPVQPLHPTLLSVPSSAASHLHLSLLRLPIRTLPGKMAGFVAPVAD